MTKKEKVTFIETSKHKPAHKHISLNHCTDEELNEMILQIAMDLIRESDIIANAYIQGYR